MGVVKQGTRVVGDVVADDATRAFDAYESALAELRRFEASAAARPVLEKFKALLNKVEEREIALKDSVRGLAADLGRGVHNVFEGRYTVVKVQVPYAAERWDADVFRREAGDTAAKACLNETVKYEVDVAYAKEIAKQNSLVRKALEAAYVPPQPKTPAVEIKPVVKDA